MASPRTVSDEFNDENNQNKSVNWGEVGRDGSIRKIVTEERKTVGVETRKQSRNFAANDPRYQQTTDEAFNSSYAKQGVQPVSLDDKSVKNPRNTPEKPEGDTIKELQPREVPRNPQANRKKIMASQSFEKESKLKAKKTVTRINLTILSVGGSLWISLQLPLAILSLVFFAISSALYAAKGFLASNPDDGVIMRGVRAIGRGIAWTVETANATISYLTGINLFDVINPANFFFLTLFLIISIFAIFQLFVIYLIYKLFNINSLGGDGAGFKIGTLILCFIGYSTPLLNLFPWFLVWTAVVWLKPK